MTKQQLDRFRGVLKAEVAELERLTSLRDGIAIERNSDQIEEIQRASERALAVSNLDRGSTQLRNARAALRRIGEGSFGVCQDCGEDIHARRLTAVPSAQYCLPCQEAVDSQGEIRTPFLADAA